MAEQENPLTQRQKFWIEHMRRCEASGLSLAAYAAEHELSVGAMYAFRRWQRERQVDLAPARFVRAPARAAVASTTLPCRVHLRNGVMIELGVQACDLSAVLTTVSELA